MGYCRIQNTLKDLQDAYGEMSSTGLAGLSEEERKAAFKLIKVCKDISDEFGDEEPGDYDDEE
jgi:hypothetical protein